MRKNKSRSKVFTRLITGAFYAMTKTRQVFKSRMRQELLYARAVSHKSVVTKMGRVRQ